MTGYLSAHGTNPNIFSGEFLDLDFAGDFSDENRDRDWVPLEDLLIYDPADDLLAAIDGEIEDKDYFPDDDFIYLEDDIYAAMEKKMSWRQKHYEDFDDGDFTGIATFEFFPGEFWTFYHDAYPADSNGHYRRLVHKPTADMPIEMDDAIGFSPSFYGCPLEKTRLNNWLDEQRRDGARRVHEGEYNGTHQQRAPKWQQGFRSNRYARETIRSVALY